MRDRVFNSKKQCRRVCRETSRWMVGEGHEASRGGGRGQPTMMMMSSGGDTTTRRRDWNYMQIKQIVERVSPHATARFEFMDAACICDVAR
jgi:hypothetical protein